jgi:hypothetical protein
MIIYLDFDGTVVEHQYPKIGRENFGCMPVIKKLQEAGHTIILNTFRANIDPVELQRALDYLNHHHKYELAPIIAAVEKIYPPRWDWNTICDTGIMFIDDIAENMRLKSAVMSPGKMVHWDYLDKEFEQKGIYNPINNTTND